MKDRQAKAKARCVRLAAECSRLANSQFTRSSRRRYREIYRQLQQARRIVKEVP